MSENPYQTPQHNPSTPAPITSENRYGPVRNLSALASFCKVMLGINIILVVAGLLVVYSSAYDQFVADALIGVLDEEGFYQQLLLLGIAEIVTFVLTVIAVCMWSYRAMANTWGIGKIRPTITAGWAAGWYFIPIAWFWKPYEAMSEIWSGVHGYSKSRALLLLWWLPWIISKILDRVSMKLELEQIEATRQVDTASVILSTIAALCLIKIITSVTEYQNSKAVR